MPILLCLLWANAAFMIILTHEEDYSWLGARGGCMDLRQLTAARATT